MDNRLFTMRRIPFDNVLNFRSLGGHAAGPQKEQVTKHGVFYRSARLHNLTEADTMKFDALHLGTIIDLREPTEAANDPDFCLGDDRYRYHNIDVMPVLNPEFLEKMAAHQENRGKTGEMGTMMLDFYKQMLDSSQAQIGQVFHAIARGLESGGVVYHCSIGRDRTGVISMLLLLLAGVDEKDIIADYQITETYLYELDPRLETPKQNMAKTISHLKDTYGGVGQYLEKIGVTQREIDLIITTFVD